ARRGPLLRKYSVGLESGWTGQALLLEGMDARLYRRRGRRLAWPILQFLSANHRGAISRSAKDVHAAGYRRSDADAAADDDVHDRVHGFHVLQSAGRLVHLFHPLQPLGNLRAEAPSQ